MRQKCNYLFNGLLFSGLACFSYLFLVLYSDFTPQHLEVLISFKSFILILAAFNLVGFGVLMIHNWQKRSFQFLVKRKERLIIDCILTAIILFLMNYLVWSVVKAIFEVPEPFTLKGPGLRMISLVWLVEMVITNLTLTINFYRQLVLLHERAEQIEENSIKARYMALQNQLNPHFLFNSLNTLISEIEYAPGNAVLFTQRLSDVYRYILQSQQQRLVTLESELSFIDSYIFLHKVRLGDCIRIENKVGSDNYDLKLPPLTLQLLVENVIKHNIINMDIPMSILIGYEPQGERIVVTNEIRIKPNVVSTGMGLKNLSARYRLICDRDIYIESNTNYFTVKVPILNE
ncbi:sensor histidine kinase [Bacteroides fragilis]|uniref:Histidine kinase n=1 Tax=Bacteroides fragilis TaxID=817 RepID=A0A853PRI1_BACFG|nr:histidine kinase [Bacteroides fragilis]EYA37867.1 histidine kinase family protein [Bacteroides fragilis str. 20793-3]OCR28933.1 histidine kinase [Bacteroides fragilis]PJY64168.1 putative sensor histidine kinase, YpdA-like [Bacteroides fragilis]